MDPIESLRFFYQGTVPFAQCAYVMGVAILAEHLRSAAEVLINGSQNGHYSSSYTRLQRFRKREHEEEVQQSLAFVQGTGLNLVIEEYGLSVDPEEFKEGFFNFCQYQKRLKKRSKSS